MFSALESDDSDEESTSAARAIEFSDDPEERRARLDDECEALQAIYADDFAARPGESAVALRVGAAAAADAARGAPRVAMGVTLVLRFSSGYPRVPPRVSLEHPPAAAPEPAAAAAEPAAPEPLPAEAARALLSELLPEREPKERPAERAPP